MKKLAIGLVAVVSAIIMCFAMTACTTKVAGKTYKFDSVEVSGELTDAGKESLEQMGYEATLDGVKKMYEEMSEQDGKITFNDDNTMSYGDYKSEHSIWKQDGKKVSVGYKDEDGEDWENATEYTVSGSKLVCEETVYGVTIKVTLKKA